MYSSFTVAMFRSLKYQFIVFCTDNLCHFIFDTTFWPDIGNDIHTAREGCNMHDTGPVLGVQPGIGIVLDQELGHDHVALHASQVEWGLGRVA